MRWVHCTSLSSFAFPLSSSPLAVFRAEKPIEAGTGLLASNMGSPSARTAPSSVSRPSPCPGNLQKCTHNTPPRWPCLVANLFSLIAACRQLSPCAMLSSTSFYSALCWLSLSADPCPLSPFIVSGALPVVPAKLVKRILNSDFIDMADLLKDNMEIERRLQDGSYTTAPFDSRCDRWKRLTSPR